MKATTPPMTEFTKFALTEDSLSDTSAVPLIF